MTSPPRVTQEDLVRSLAAYDTDAQPGTCQTERYCLRYVTWGAGPGTLVFIHGMNDQARSFALVMQALAPHYRCVAYQLADGRHDGACIGAYRHADFAHDLVALLDHLDLDQADLLGSSFGSTIALNTARVYHQRIRRVILKGGFARRPLQGWQRALARPARWWPWLMRELPFRQRILRSYEAHAFADVDPALLQFLIDSSGATPCRAAARRTLMLNTLDLRPMLPRIPHPVLLVGGSEDRIVPNQYERELEELLPHARRVEIPGCGHYPQYTHPRELADILLSFLRG